MGASNLNGSYMQCSKITKMAEKSLLLVLRTFMKRSHREDFSRCNFVMRNVVRDFAFHNFLPYSIIVVKAQNFFSAPKTNKIIIQIKYFRIMIVSYIMLASVSNKSYCNTSRYFVGDLACTQCVLWRQRFNDHQRTPFVGRNIKYIKSTTLSMVYGSMDNMRYFLKRRVHYII
jgi:hypothetical protein